MKHASLFLICLWWADSLNATAEQPAQQVADVPNLVAFWTFGDAEGEPKRSLVNPALELLEQNGPIKALDGGPFGSAIKINQGQWLSIPREKIGPLNIHGPDAQVTVVAWIYRNQTSHWQAIAGVWDETRNRRQYCLFLNAAKQTDFRTMTRTPSKDRFQGHVSSIGGRTPDEEACITYATSGQTVPLGEWQSLAMTYDGEEVRLYLNGSLSQAEGMNPFPYRQGLFDGQDDGADFTVGSVNVAGKPGNFLGATLGGIAIFDRALTAGEIASLPK
ncbi:LamG domain-containing protein [Neorhodopirellula pilleata]|nr:LamG domain-containing protein [Neorhodopirellula pilleata]